jgi:GTPase Era involved in 16S rRNA processing
MSISTSNDYKLLFVDTPGPNEALGTSESLDLYPKLINFVQQCQKTILVVNIAELSSEAFKKTVDLVIKAYETRGNKAKSFIIVLNKLDLYKESENGPVKEFIDNAKKVLEEQLKFSIDCDLIAISANQALLAKAAYKEAKKEFDKEKLKDFAKICSALEYKEWLDKATPESIENAAKKLHDESQFDLIYKVIINKLIPDMYSDLFNLCKLNLLEVLKNISSKEVSKFKSNLSNDNEKFGELVDDLNNEVTKINNRLNQASEDNIKRAKDNIKQELETLRELLKRKFPNSSECEQSIIDAVNTRIENVNQIFNNLIQNLTERAEACTQELQTKYLAEIKSKYLEKLNTKALQDCLDITFNSSEVYLKPNSGYCFPFNENEYIFQDRRFETIPPSSPETGEVCIYSPLSNEFFCQWYEVLIDSLLQAFTLSIDSHFEDLNIEDCYNLNHITNTILNDKQQKCSDIVETNFDEFSKIVKKCDECVQYINENFLVEDGQAVDISFSQKLIDFSEKIIPYLKVTKDKLEPFGSIEFIEQAILQLPSDFKALKDKKLKVAVIGTGKAGKSSFINALIGDGIALSRITAATLLPQLFIVESENLKLEVLNDKIDYMISSSFIKIFEKMYQTLLEINPINFENLHFIKTDDTNETLEMIKNKTLFNTISSSSNDEKKKWISMCNDLLRISFNLDDVAANNAMRAMDMPLEEYPLVQLLDP